MHEGPHVQIVDAEVGMAAAVHRQGAAEPLSLGVHRPVLPGAEMSFQAVGGQHGPHQTELCDRPTQLLHRGFGNLHRQQRHPAEPLVGGGVGVAEPVVVGPGQRHRHLRVVDPADGQARGRVEHRGGDADGVEELPPLRGPHPPGPVEAGRGVPEAGVNMVQGREQPHHRRDEAHAAGRLQGHLPVRLGQVLEDLRGVLLHVPVGVDHPHRCPPAPPRPPGRSAPLRRTRRAPGPRASPGSRPRRHPSGTPPGSRDRGVTRSGPWDWSGCRTWSSSPPG